MTRLVYENVREVISGEECRHQPGKTMQKKKVKVVRGENNLKGLHSAISNFDDGRFFKRHSVTTYLPAVTRVVTIMR